MPRRRARRKDPAKAPPPIGWTEETLRAIRAGEADAFVLTGPTGDRTFELNSEQRPYRVLIERMNEGAVTLAADGTILYCNRRFDLLVHRPHQRVLGAALRHFVRAADRPALDDLLARAGRAGVAGEVTFQSLRGTDIPVLISLGPVPPELRGNARGRPARQTRIVGVVTDVTERHEAARRRDRLHQRLMVAADEERRRIARELHDETGQSLTALLVGLRTLALAPTLEDARASALRLRELVALTLDDVGRLARGLHPRVLDELGLATAAARHAEEFERSYRIRVALRTWALERRLPPPVTTAVYRLLQEALTNIAKHARARAVRIRLHADARAVVLEVRDDGHGFDPEAIGSTRDGAHLGLLGMRERAALFGGTLDVRSGRGRGTTIVARLPLPPAAARGRRRQVRARINPA